MKPLGIDADGFPVSDGLRWVDADLGHELFSNLSLNANKNVIGTVQGQQFLLEAFDEPLIVQGVTVQGRELLLDTAFGTQTSTAEMFLDEWDRLRGFDRRGISFVFSRKAQAQLFEAADEYDDDSISLAGHRWTLANWYEESDFNWEESYLENNTQWNLGEMAPGLADLIPRLKLPKLRVLVLGCGHGHDALAMARLGHAVTAVDQSKQAILAAQKSDTQNLVTWKNVDAWQVSGEFDLICEHTFYCAIEPSARDNLVRLWRQRLVPGGYLLGVFFAMPKRKGPPFGGSEWELQKRLGKDFQSLYWGRCRSLTEARQGKEFAVFAQFKKT